MKMERATMVLGLGIALTISFAILSWGWLQSSYQSAADLDRDLTQMRELADEIEQLRNMADSAFVFGEQPLQTTRMWVDLGQQAKIEESQFDSFDSWGSQIEDSQYSREDWRIRMSRATTQQIASYLVLASESDSGYSPTSMNLTALPSGQGERETWSVELILTRLVYITKKNSAPE